MSRLRIAAAIVAAAIAASSGGQVWGALQVSPGSSGGDCSTRGCNYGGGGAGAAPGRPAPSGAGGGRRSGGSGAGATTCTATDYTKDPPVEVTGPITSIRAYGPGGALLVGGAEYYPSPRDAPKPDDPEPPSPDGRTDGHWYAIYCGGVLRDFEWIPDGAEPTPVATGADPAAVVAAARAHLPLKPPTIHMNPDPAQVPALVGMPTWFWVDPGDIGRLGAGASQNGVVVDGFVAADHIVVDPGDGTGAFVCAGSGTPWAPGATTTNCSHTYTRSSAGKGTNNNFTVRVTVVWAGNFTVTIGGAPAGGGVLGPINETAQTPIRVAEAQAVNHG